MRRESPSIEDFWLSLGILIGMLARDDVRFDVARHCQQDARGRAYVRLLTDKLTEILADIPQEER